jgi:hypothetical protein
MISSRIPRSQRIGSWGIQEMSHIYQPLLLRILVEAGGTATVRQIAHGFLAQDESQLRYYESRIKQMPVPVLKKAWCHLKGG